MDPGRNMGKTNPLNDKIQALNCRSKQFSDVDEDTFDLSVKTPIREETPLRVQKRLLLNGWEPNIEKYQRSDISRAGK